MQSELGGKRALVTGGGSGIGRAIALALAAEGTDVAIATRRPADSVVSELVALGARGHAIAADVSREEDVVRMISSAVEFLGGLDLFVSVAAGRWNEPITQLTDGRWQQTIDTNVSACVWGCREIARQFIAQRSGTVLAVGSTATKSAQPTETSYRASKAALAAHIEVLAVELAPFGVRANLLTPGAVDTPFIEDLSGDSRKATIQAIPMGREALPEEVAPAAIFLLSDRLAGYVTGAELVVDGGLQLRPVFRGSHTDLAALNAEHLGNQAL